MKKSLDEIVFYICLTVSIGLITGGFFVPPKGVIDGSVLTAVGLLLGFASLATLKKVLNEGKGAKMTKGDLTINIGEDNTDNND